MKELWQKICCLHKWTVHYQANLYKEGTLLDDETSLPHTRRRTLICKKCGKITQINL